MQPSRDGALVDLVDRILAKGVILQADVIISVSGVPLIGVNLKAAIASLTTMIDYGMMETWDEQTRKSILAESKEEIPLCENEEIILETFGSYYFQDKSVSGVWRAGYLYVTNKRLFLFRKKPTEILFETAISRIKGLSVDMNESLGEKRTIRVLLKNDDSANEVALLRIMEVDALKNKLEEIMREAAESEKVLVSVN